LDLVNINEHEAAFKIFDQILLINPNYVDALGNKGSILSIRGDDRAALDCFNQIEKINPNLALTYCFRYKNHL
jgi:tetratricopeptide (TPR) repeat protein